MHLRLFYSGGIKGILVLSLVICNFVNGYWSNLQNTGQGTGFGSVIEELFRQGPESFKEKIEEDEDSDNSAEKQESIVGGTGEKGTGNAAIVCPSGNKVYVHPISGDLQQCSQQLGFYNQTTCPGGTVCERFPILVPGFQDYCCWGNDTTDSETIIIGDLKGSSVIDSLPDVDSSSGDINGVGSISGGFTISPRASSKTTDNDEDEWIITTVTPKTRRTRRPRPRSRKTSTTATTEVSTTTTTPVPPTTPPRRGPRCRNSDDAALIDFGNRLRDCYYQQCPYGYRCEFNSDIRRYICCGKERDVFPPPGLPPLPQPRPLVPRPFRPRPPPPYMFGEEGTNSHSFLETTNDDENDQISIDSCPLGQEHRGVLGGVTFCEPSNLNLACPSSHPYCVHSAMFGANVCCAHSETWVMTS